MVFMFKAPDTGHAECVKKGFIMHLCFYINLFMMNSSTTVGGLLECYESP